MVRWAKPKIGIFEGAVDQRLLRLIDADGDVEGSIGGHCPHSRQSRAHGVSEEMLTRAIQFTELGSVAPGLKDWSAHSGYFVSTALAVFSPSLAWKIQ